MALSRDEKDHLQSLIDAQPEHSDLRKRTDVELEVVYEIYAQCAPAMLERLPYLVTASWMRAAVLVPPGPHGIRDLCETEIKFREANRIVSPRRGIEQRGYAPHKGL